ncbi:MAG: glycosyltransferase family 2 protein [Planctomycetaceae bacterium]|nr:glycosyltransferase family 2 protein [Planctomycetaceae bacterium]
MDRKRATAMWIDRNDDSPQGESVFCPEAVVLLCVRGHDPFLAQTIRALSRQDYANYRIIVVVDHRQDPAWKVVEDTKLELGINDQQLELQELVSRHDQCGLKCSSLIQALESLPDENFDHRIIVTIDSDAVPGKEWLANMVFPLAQREVGAATSNQWFEPREWSLGSWVRSVWHAGAIVPTAMLGNPWAGGFAIRQADLAESGLIEAWRTSIIDDGPVREGLQRLGKRIEFVPQNIVINREACRLDYCLRYVARMLTWSRLFESTFWMTGIHALVTTTIQLMIVLWCMLAILSVGSATSLTAALGAIGLPAASVAVILLGQVLGFYLVRRAIFRVTTAKDEANPTPGELQNSPIAGLFQFATICIGVPLANLAYAVGCFQAMRVKRVVWRNIAYEIDNGRKVKMLGYAPYVAEKPHVFENHSV